MTFSFQLGFRGLQLILGKQSMENLRLMSFWFYSQSYFYLNIIAVYSVTNAEADGYMEHYIKYCASIQLLNRFGSKPNHHYTMHNGNLPKFWGLYCLSEFPGEQMNGDMGKIKTNCQFCGFFNGFFLEYWTDN